MVVKINGETCAFEEDKLSIIDLLRLRDVKNPNTVSVQLNGRFVNRENWDTSFLKENDVVDYLFFMSGGIFRSAIIRI